jgi:MFS transporter, PPP family, 3-phenylpropionic acid transporter
MKSRSVFLLACSFYVINFMGGASFTSFIGLYYASINLTHSQIGFIGSISPIISLVAQPFWGTLADRAKYKNSILQICLLLSSILVWMIPFAGNNMYLLVAAIALFGFAGAMGPIGDSISIELAKKVGFKFSHVRTAGSLGFALMSFIAAKVLTIDLRLIFVIFCFMRFSAMIVAGRMPKIEGHDYKESGKKSSIFLLLEDHRLVVILGFTFLLSCTMQFFNSFHSIYSVEKKVPMELLGFGIMIGSFSQFPFMLGFDKIYARFGIVKIMAFAGIIYSLRWFLYLFVDVYAVFIVIWILHGGTFILLYLCISHYMHDTVKPELRTRGQAMNHIMLFGASAIIGSFIGGIISSHIGLRNTFGGCAAFCLVVTLIFILLTTTMPAFRKTLPVFADTKPH